MPSLPPFEPFGYALPGIALGILLAGTIYGLYLRALPKPLPGIPFSADASGTVWGDITSLSNDTDGLAQWCSKQLRKHGYPLAQVFMGPFSKPVILVADVGETRDIMMRSDFDRSVYIIDRFPLFGGSQIVKRTGEEWRTSRGWLKDLLTPRYLQTVAGPEIYSSVCRLIELWELSSKFAGPDRPIDMVEDLKDLALDVVTQFHHGNGFHDLALKRQVKHIQSLQPGASKLAVGPEGAVALPRAPMNAFGEGVTEIGDRMGAIYTMSSPPGLVSFWTKHFMPRYRRFFAVKQRFMRRRFDESIARLRNGEEATTAIDHMVFREDKAATKAGRKPLYNEQIMIDEAFGNHIAGQHTTSSAMVWILKYLTENQDVQKRLRRELHAAFPTAVQENYRLPTQSELMSTSLPYLDAVIEETLRLRAAFLIARDAVRDTELLGHLIPKGTVCLLVCQGLEGISYEPAKGAKPARAFPGNGNPDPQVFDPERWLVRKGDQVSFDGSSTSHMAFGLGIRACWGRKLAELEMRMMTAMVTWSFELLTVPAPLTSHEAIYDFSYRAKHGFVRLRKREEMAG